MKSSIGLNTGIAAVVFGLLAGCGQTGPLYLPKPPTKPASPAPVVTTPAPPSLPSASQ